MNRLKLEALITSVLIYLIIIVTIFSIALYSPDDNIKPKKYVAKKSNVIEVSLGTPSKTKAYKVSKNSKKSVKKKEQKKKKIVKKVRNIHKKEPKKVVKKVTKKPTKKKIKKVVKKATKPTKKSNPKVANASSLFKKLPKSIKDDAPAQNSGKAGKSLKKANQGKGIQNRYFAKIQSTLRGWPAQSNFAGEKVKVELTVYPTGLFDYKILSRSLNPEFNRSLSAYLEQLKKFGFGPHSNPKPYKIIVEFIAKE
jgi:outer membrane biosynthesis protein TonB